MKSMKRAVAVATTTTTRRGGAPSSSSSSSSADYSLVRAEEAAAAEDDAVIVDDHGVVAPSCRRHHLEEDEEEEDATTTTMLTDRDDDATLLVPPAAGATIYSRASDNNNDDDDNAAAASSSLRWDGWWHRTLLPDDAYAVCGVQLVDGIYAVKFLKFLFWSVMTIIGVYWFVRVPFLNIENKAWLTLADLSMYQSTDIIMDCLVFFVVGRMHRLPGVDHAAWMGTVMLCQVYFCTLEQMSFLKHSWTLYEMHCRWPWMLWLFVLVMLPLVITLILLHVHYAVQHRIFFMKLIELALCVLLFLVPYLPSKYLHLHHWFVGWWLGMHCNFSDCWWSRAAMAWCWGVFLNGIAVYGRDPLLTCGAAFYWSNELRCPFLDCYLEGIHRPQNESTPAHPAVKPMTPPNWRNCSADSYHP